MKPGLRRKSRVAASCPKAPDYAHCAYNYTEDECPRAGKRSHKCGDGGLCCFDGCRNACFTPPDEEAGTSLADTGQKFKRRGHR